MTAGCYRESRRTPPARIAGQEPAAKPRPKPRAKPIAKQKPAPKPLPKRVVKPASKPVAKPMPKPASKPVPKRKAASRAAGPTVPNAVKVDKNRTVAAPKRSPTTNTKSPSPKRHLAFQVTGYGVEPRVGDAGYRKNSALEAAVIDAIGRVAREIQRDPKSNRTQVEYKLRLSPGLTVFGQLVSGAPQTVLMLNRHGRITELCAGRGVLAHPPHDSELIQQVFAASQGRLALLGTKATRDSGRYAADVGYYRTAGTRPTTASAPSKIERPAAPAGK